MRNINRFLEILNYVIGNNKNITYNFFATFSRFEFALKHNGYATGDRRRNALANWDLFAEDHNEIFIAKLKEQNKDLAESVKYLFENPPRKLKFDQGQLKWEERHQINKENLKELLLIVRAIRNNLFHGSKKVVIFNEPTRDSKLINSSLIILNECLELNENLRRKFIEEQ